jgi:hypothetical protein
MAQRTIPRLGSEICTSISKLNRACGQLAFLRQTADGKLRPIILRLKKQPQECIG